ncbi:hypothetical protein HHL10_01685 [Azohydromonas sp. G-1-1-14]|uniref:Uncharacterized protein n=1 Tax=Azohydromonas caseinilytica TaxID=2728836 RepID=A0A848F2R3_9BURK|nr:hypothetical protein [Azohydromonas caseinilytica]
MRAQLQNRRSELQAQLNEGQNALAELNRRQEELRTTLLRISGAIQVLSEVLGDEPAAATSR